MMPSPEDPERGIPLEVLTFTPLGAPILNTGFMTPANGDEAERDDPFRVTWESDTDPKNPQNWSVTWRWITIVTVSIITFVSSMTPTIVVPAVVDIYEYFFETNEEIWANAVLLPLIISMWAFGAAFGPLVAAPLSERYGRVLVFVFSGSFLSLCEALSLLCVRLPYRPSIASFLVFRFFSGFFGVVPMALGSSIIADVMPPDNPHMGKAMALWSTSWMLGLIIAPVLGGVVRTYSEKGWETIGMVQGQASGWLAVLGVFLIFETYGPVILARKAKALRKRTKDHRYYVAHQTKKTARNIANDAFLRPIKLAVTSPLLIMVSTYSALLFGIQFHLITTQGIFYDDAFRVDKLLQGSLRGIAGVPFLANGLGAVLGGLMVGIMSEKWWPGKKHNVKAEQWLWAMFPGGLISGAGLFGYSFRHIMEPDGNMNRDPSVVLPALSSGIFGFGLAAVLLSGKTYLVKGFPIYSATVLAGYNFLCAIAAGTLPLIGIALMKAIPSNPIKTDIIFAVLVIGGSTIGIMLHFLGLGEKLRYRMNAA